MGCSGRRMARFGWRCSVRTSSVTSTRLRGSWWKSICRRPGLVRVAWRSRPTDGSGTRTSHAAISGCMTRRPRRRKSGKRPTKNRLLMESASRPTASFGSTSRVRALFAAWFERAGGKVGGNENRRDDADPGGGHVRREGGTGQATDEVDDAERQDGDQWEAKHAVKIAREVDRAARALISLEPAH